MASYAPPDPNPPPPIFNYYNFIANDQPVTMNYVNSTFLKLSGGTMTGNLFSQGIYMNGNLSLDNASSTLIITNTSASIGIGTGALQCSGGAYFGNSCYINGDLIATSINALNSLEISGSGHLTVSSSSHIKINSTSDATAFTDASIYSKGGIYLLKSIISLGTDTAFQSILMNGSINMNNNSLYNASTILSGTLSLNNTNDSLTITNTNTSGRSNIKCVSNLYSYEHGIRGSTATNPNTVYWYYNGNYRMLMDISGNLNLLSTTDATSYNTASMNLSGSLGVAKKCYINSNTYINSTLQITGSGTITSGAGFELGYVLGQSNIYSYDRTNSVYKKLNINDFAMIDKANEALEINTTQIDGYINIGSSTGAPNLIDFYTNNNSNFLGKLGFVQNSTINALTFTSQNNTSGINNISYLTNEGKLSLGKYNTYPRYILDCGQSAGNIVLSLYSASSGTDSFSIGANGGNMLFHSTNSHKFYTQTNVDGTLGTEIATIWSTGSIEAKANLKAQGLWINSYSTDLVSGSGLKLHYGGGLAQIFSYNYSSNQYLPVQIGHYNFITEQTGNANSGLNLNTSDTSYHCSLYVKSTSGFVKNASFGYLSQSGAGTGSGINNIQVSIYSEGSILVDSGAVYVYSDLRLKKDISTIDDNMIDRFLEIEPIKFKYKSQSDDDQFHYSYSAQEFVKQKIDVVHVSKLNDSIEIEAQDIIDIDNNIFHLPADMKLTLSLESLVPFLHKIVKKQNKEIILLQEKLNKLENIINRLI